MKCCFHLYLVLLSVALSGCSFAEKENNTLTKSEIKKGWKLLLNGDSLSNWKIYNGGEVVGWRIENGVLYNSGDSREYGGDIITKDEYRNFELNLEWSVSPKSSSGIFFHVQEGIVNTIQESGPEYQLIDDMNQEEQLPGNQRSGANFGMHSAGDVHVVPSGKWNKTKLIVDGPHVEHWLNGRKVLGYELWSDEWSELKKNSRWKNMPFYGTAKEGHIGLQDHGGVTMFRNIKIRELKQEEK